MDGSESPDRGVADGREVPHPSLVGGGSPSMLLTSLVARMALDPGQGVTVGVAMRVDGWLLTPCLGPHSLLPAPSQHTPLAPCLCSSPWSHLLLLQEGLLTSLFCCLFSLSILGWIINSQFIRSQRYTKVPGESSLPALFLPPQTARFAEMGFWGRQVYINLHICSFLCVLFCFKHKLVLNHAPCCPSHSGFFSRHPSSQRRLFLI